MHAEPPIDPTEAARGTLRIHLDGVTRDAVAGQSIAAAMAGGDGHAFSRDVAGNPRGVFCGMGACHDCLVTVDGRISQRACITIVADGMRIERPSSRPALAEAALSDLCPVPAALFRRSMDVLVIGAGPAGLAAAESAASAGAAVTVIDERPSAGGQFFKQPATDAAIALLDGDEQAGRGAGLIRRVRDLGVAIAKDTLVWGAAHEEDGLPLIGCYGPDGAFYCKPKMLIIATGAFERPSPVPGWTLPGVMTAGATQTFLRSYGTLPGKRILIAGNGPLNLQVASEILKVGGEVAALVEAASPPWTRPGAAAGLFTANPALALRGMRQTGRLRAAGIPLLWQSEVVSVEGEGHAERVAVRTPEGLRHFDIDTVLLGGGFSPANELSRLLGCAHEAVSGRLKVRCGEGGETTIPHIHVVGEAVRFAGAHVALAEGRLAGQAVAAKLGFSVSPDAGAKTKLAHAHLFQKALWALFDPVISSEDALAADTIICRCEAVTYGKLKALAEIGVRDIATLKRLSRAGMGRCQSRYCATTLAKIADNTNPRGETEGMLAPQMPLRPVPLAALAVEKPEWGGHKRALLPQKPAPESPGPLPVSNVSTLVIGAGIAGLSTALFLAREGEDVAVVERAYPNSLASGGNAGSLHAQLLSFDHGARAEGGGGPAAQTLPLQRDSITLWGALQKELGLDFEMKVTGGLMVGETESHMRFLEQKAAVERSVGIDCHVIGRDELRRLEPALSETFVGAAYCPQEGKINPLVATQGILDAARAAGAQVFHQTEVMAIEAEAAGFRVTTSRGIVTASRIVNASGAFSSRIGAMLGLDIPVFGAPLQMVVTEAAAPLISCLVAHADRHLTLKQATNGNFIIGGGWTAGLDPVHQHPRPLFSSIEGNLWVAQHVVPALRKLHVIRTWAAMNINIDGAPILGEHPGRPGFFNAVTSNGYTLGPLVGRLTASLVAGRDTGRDLQPFSISRFAKGRS